MNHPRARNRSPRRLFIALFVALCFAGGCASHPMRITEQAAPASTSLCTTVRCLHQAVTEPYYRMCLDSLFSQTARRSERDAINNEFRYPFSNANGYFSWMKMGGSGPAPQEWCRHYAYKKVTTPYGRQTGAN